MRILLGGGSGLIGTALAKALAQRGDQVIQLVRKPPSLANSSLQIAWDIEAGRLDAQAIEGFDAVIHLGGANIAERLWSEKRKHLLRSSRIDSTKLLAETLAKLSKPPRVFLAASAIGFYGDCGDTLLDESSPRGSGFLAELARDWEAAALPAQAAGIRLLWLRTGIVLSREGGALAKLWTLFRFGLGGKLGSGRQFMSWISLEDAVGAILYALDNPISGPINLTAPHPVDNLSFTRSLAKVLHRPALFPVPTALLRILLGEAADELLLSSQRVLPKALLKGYRFQHPELEALLSHYVQD